MLISALILMPALEPRLVTVVGLLTAGAVVVATVCVTEVEFADSGTDDRVTAVVLLASVSGVEVIEGCTDSSVFEEDEKEAKEVEVNCVVPVLAIGIVVESEELKVEVSDVASCWLVLVTAVVALVGSLEEEPLDGT